MERGTTRSAGDARPVAAAGVQTMDPQWAWARYEPSDERPWTAKWAGHLLRRTTFGFSWLQLEQALRDGPQQTVTRLLKPDEVETAAFARTFDSYEQAAGRSGNIQTLRAWWLRRMVETPDPLREKMTLFWHSHFGISHLRVQSASLMLGHVQMLRRHALGQYRQMATEAARDPAVYLGLAGQANRKALPNRAFAQQWLERLGGGQSQYGQEDVREAARAMTGWFVLRGQLRFLAREHDEGTKTIMGQRGNWKAEDVARIVLDQPATALQLARKLYRWFVSEAEEPPPSLLQPIVQAMGSDYDIGRALETILRSNLFFSSVAYRQRIKCPVQFALEIVKAMEAMVATAPLASDLAQLGQSLYAPPTIKGWQGGRHWINAATLIGRANLARRLFSSSGPYAGQLDPEKVARRYGRRQLDEAADLLVQLFLQGDVRQQRSELLERAGGRAGLAQQLRELACQIVTLSEFQLS